MRRIQVWESGKKLVDGLSVLQTITSGGDIQVLPGVSHAIREGLDNAIATNLILPSNAPFGAKIKIIDRASLGWISPVRVSAPAGGGILIGAQNIGTFWDILHPSSFVVLEHVGNNQWIVEDDGLPANHQGIYYSKCEFTNPADFRNGVFAGAGAAAVAGGGSSRSAMQMETGTTATGVAHWGGRTGNTNTTNNGYFVPQAGQPIRLRCCFSLPVLSTATERFLAQIGMSSALSTAVGTNGFWLRYRDDINTGNFSILCQRDGVSSQINSGVAAVAGTWYEVAFECVSGELRSWLRSNASQSDLLAVNNWTQLATINTNVPTDRSLGDHIFNSKSVGTANRALAIDWYRSLARQA